MSGLWEGIDIGVSIKPRSFSLVVDSLEVGATELPVKLEHEESQRKNDSQGKALTEQCAAGNPFPSFHDSSDQFI